MKKTVHNFIFPALKVLSFSQSETEKYFVRIMVPDIAKTKSTELYFARKENKNKRTVTKHYFL